MISHTIHNSLLHEYMHSLIHVSIQMWRLGEWFSTMFTCGFSPVWAMAAHTVFSSLKMKNMISHNSHMNMAFLLYECACVDSNVKTDRVNDFSQCSYEYFSPVWKRMWLVKPEHWVNDFPQWTHDYGVSPVWLCMCLFNFEGWGNDFPQCTH